MNKLLIETFIMYCISSGFDCPTYDIFQFMECADNSESSTEAKQRRLRRYLDDLKKIGVIDLSSRVGQIDNAHFDFGSNLPNEIFDSGLREEDFSSSITPYSSLEDKDLKTLSHIATILCSVCGEDVEHDDTIEKFKSMYFVDGFEYNMENVGVLNSEVFIISDMLRIYERMNESHLQLNNNLFNDAFSILANLKINYGYNTK